MQHTHKPASPQNQLSDQWTQGVNGVWLPKHTQAPPNVLPSKRGKQQRISWTQRRIAGKSLWDWMSLLLVPLLIGIGTILVTNRQTDAQNALSAQLHQSDQDTAQQARWDDLLRQYRDGIDALLLSNGLRHAHPGDDVSKIAHARTLDVLNAVDPSRQGSVITYLSNLKLVQGGFLDMKGVWHQQKVIVSLQGADLHRAHLFGTDLFSTDLRGADLHDADLQGLDLHDADLQGLDLHDADLSGADLHGAYLHDADLQDADLFAADLHGADLFAADLSDADITTRQLQSVFSLSETTLPTGWVCKRIPFAEYDNIKKQAENRDACLHEAKILS